MKFQYFPAYRVFIKYCVFHSIFLNFLNSASSAAALVFYLPGVCTHTDTGGKQSPENILKSSKNNIFNEHPVLCIRPKVDTMYTAWIRISTGRVLLHALSSLPKTSWSIFENLILPVLLFLCHVHPGVQGLSKNTLLSISIYLSIYQVSIYLNIYLSIYPWGSAAPLGFKDSTKQICDQSAAPDGIPPFSE